MLGAVDTFLPSENLQNLQSGGYSKYKIIMQCDKYFNRGNSEYQNTDQRHIPRIKGIRNGFLEEAKA